MWTIDQALYYGWSDCAPHAYHRRCRQGLTDALVANMSANDAITQMLSCEMQGLVLADDSDDVVGAYGKMGRTSWPSWQEHHRPASSGFNNPDMLAQYCPRPLMLSKWWRQELPAKASWAQELGREPPEHGRLPRPCVSRSRQRQNA